MSKKKSAPKAPAAGATDLPALKIGSRVRCTDDQVEGRIVWANAVSVKVQWDDGEQVTWRRDSLAGRPVEIVGAEGEEDRRLPDEPPSTGQTAAPELPRDDTPTMPGAPEAVGGALQQPAVAPSEVPVADSAPGPTHTGGAGANPEATAKPQPPATSGRQQMKVSALDAAAKVLAEEGRPMTCKEMIGTMAAKGYWTSPGGKTPDATLYSALLRELTTKGAQARFTKTDRGKFALRGTVSAPMSRALWGAPARLAPCFATLRPSDATRSFGSPRS
jgi:hypothetical protein